MKAPEQEVDPVVESHQTDVDEESEDEETSADMKKIQSLLKTSQVC